MWYKNIAGRFFGLVTKHACNRQTEGRTDGRTDGQNYDSQDRDSIAASSGKNGLPYAIRPLSVLPVLSSLSVCDVGVLWPNGWMDQDKTWLGMQVDLGPGHIVLDGDPPVDFFTLPQRGTAPPIFGPYLLWPNDWMD